MADDPYDTLIRLVRGTTYETAPEHVNKLRALSNVSALGALAYRRYAERETPAHALARPAPAPGHADELEAVRVQFHAADAALIIRAMMASGASGEADKPGAYRRILGELQAWGATPAELEFARRQIEHPATPEDLARSVVNPEAAVEIYAAALMASNAATEGARAFLAGLAAALHLDPKFVRDLHASWGDPPPWEAA